MMAKEFYAQFKEFFNINKKKTNEQGKTDSAVMMTKIPAANTVSRRLITLQFPGTSLGKLEAAHVILLTWICWNKY